MADATSGPARYLAVTVYAIALPTNSFPNVPVNRALLKVGPAAAWRDVVQAVCWRPRSWPRHSLPSTS
jgi:hypothetical protein